MTPNREHWSAIICEGYDAFYDGARRKDCPYSEGDETVEGTCSMTLSMLRCDWLHGFDIAKTELNS